MASPLFSYDTAAVAVAKDIADSHRSVWEQLGHTGTWWTAGERLAIAARARAGFAQRHQPPWARNLDPAVDGLPDEAVRAVDRLVSNPGSIDRAWVDGRVAALGDGRYVELVGVVATIVMIDMFAAGAGVDVTPLPDPSPGDVTQPSGERPGGLGDIGAYVPMLDPFPYANVARALSLVPAANQLFRTTSVPMYSAPGMSDLVWATPLERPQVELVASRVAAMNECFY